MKPTDRRPFLRMAAPLLGLALAACQTADPAKPTSATPPATTPHGTPRANPPPTVPPSANVSTMSAVTIPDGAGFPQWIAAFKAEARQQGIAQATIDKAYAGVKYNTRVIELDNFQPEFVSPIWTYIAERTKPETVARGQQLLAQHRTLLASVAAKYSVDPEVIVSIWRLESNYGDNTGSFDVVEALSTLAYAGRRKDFWREQLFAALNMIQRGDGPRNSQGKLYGSWAGAMGHTQFIPTSFAIRAVDFDGDGRRDLWTSLPDVFASTANYLNNAQWRMGERCYYEVKLPANFDWTQADYDLRKPVAEWRRLGVTLVDGKTLPALSETTSIVMPAGARGPKFLVTANFRSVMAYNNAVAYALSVCHLAALYKGGPAFVTPWPTDEQQLSRTEKIELQEALARLGYDIGRPDGQIGPKTTAAIRAYQRKVGLPADAYPTASLLARIKRGV